MAAPMPCCPWTWRRPTLAAAPYLPELLGSTDEDVLLDMLRWLRGQDPDDVDGDGDSSEARDWLLGAVLHSRPLAINYGSMDGHGAANPRVRLFVGSNDGALHAFENTLASGVESGREVFAFYPREPLAAQGLRRAAAQRPEAPLAYGVDGSPVALVRDRNGDGRLDARQGDEAIVYFGLRRGGSSYYALDVSDPKAPPTLLWRLHPGLGGGFQALGLSFSEPVVGRVRFGVQATDVLIFAGGYHGGYRADGNTPLGKDAGAADDAVGNAVFIVDARTGAPVWQALRGPYTAGDNLRFTHPGLRDSIPSRVAALRDAQGLIHRLYVGDTGGAVWRVDLPPGEGEQHRARNWFVSKLAELGDDAGREDRRFFHAADIVRTRDAAGEPFDGVVIASGNRAAPRDRSVQDYLFYLRDYAVDSGDAGVRARAALTLEQLPERWHCSSGAGPGCDQALARGWRLALARPGEKGLSTPLTERGWIYFSSFVPPVTDGQCEVTVGHSELYVVRLDNAAAAGTGSRSQRSGPGPVAGVLALADQLLLPGAGQLPAGVAGEEAGAGTGPLLPVRGQRLLPLYWREPGADEL
ncbi:MAG: pilus assembly protein [Parahaliea sp.]